MKNKYKKIYFAVIFLCFFIPSITFASYDFYVDKNSLELTENGTALAPWKTIEAALTHIRSEGLKKKKIYIKNGIYTESISITNGTKLFGESRNGTIIDATGRHNAISFNSTNSELKNMTVKNADSTNIIVEKKSRVAITDCKIEKAGDFGIEVKESSNTQKYKFSIIGSEVSESGSQGLFISKRRINISDNEIFSNGEEGIDIHSRVKGSVAGNNIHGNDESGIESMLSNANLVIRNNKIENNHTQGLTIQVYSTARGGKVRISGNTIKGNHHAGIRYANYTHSIGPNKLKIFVDKYVKLSKNTISDNDGGNIRYE